MADMVQANARVPEAARPALMKVAARLRDDPSFLDRLQVFLGDEAVRLVLGEAGVPPWVERIEAIEARLAALEGAGKSAAVADLTPIEMAAPALDEDWPTHAAGITISTGEGRGRRLTVEGAALFEEMVRAGVRNPEIARIFGMANQSVRARAKKISNAHSSASAPSPSP